MGGRPNEKGGPGAAIKPDALQTFGRVGRLLDRDYDRIVILLRWNFQTAGEILELDGEENLLRHHPELVPLSAIPRGSDKALSDRDLPVSRGTIKGIDVRPP